MRWMFLLCAVGCVPGDLEAFGDPLADGTPFLVDDADEAFPERARLVAMGEASLLPDGPPLEGGDGWVPYRDLVVVDVAERVRVQHEAGGVQLLLWLERADLAQVIVDGAYGGARPEEAGVEGVRLPPGLAVEVGEPSGRFLRVGVQTDEVAVDVWVEDHEVDHFYVSGLPPSEDGGWPGHLLRGQREILDRPFGDVLAVTLPHRDGAADAPWIPVLVEGDAEDQHLPVFLDTEGVEITGWVHVDDVTERTSWSGGSGCGGCIGCGGWGMWPTNVPAGTLLRERPYGPVVGRTLRDLYASYGDDGAWGRLTARTPWGEAELLAPPQDELVWPED